MSAKVAPLDLPSSRISSAEGCILSKVCTERFDWILARSCFTTALFLASKAAPVSFAGVDGFFFAVVAATVLGTCFVADNNVDAAVAFAEADFTKDVVVEVFVAAEGAGTIATNDDAAVLVPGFLEAEFEAMTGRSGFLLAERMASRE